MGLRCVVGVFCYEVMKFEWILQVICSKILGQASAKRLPSASVISSLVYSLWKSCCRRCR